MEQSWSYKNIELLGLSLSGIRTCIALPQLQLCFDVAQGLPFALKQKKFFITHGHLDHAAGIPYIISQKALNNDNPPQFFVPPSLLEPITKIMQLWEKIEDHQYRLDFTPVQAGEEIFLNNQYLIRPFKTFHRIESLGYTLIQTHKKLRPEYLKKSEAELKKLSTSGVEITSIQKIPLVSFTGDTQIDFLDHQPEIGKSKILILECTYLDDAKDVQHARKWGHTHLYEIIPRLDTIEAEKIVLIHLSARYSWKDAQAILTNKIPKKHQDRIVLFPGR